MLPQLRAAHGAMRSLARRTLSSTFCGSNARNLLGWGHWGISRVTGRFRDGADGKFRSPCHARTARATRPFLRGQTSSGFWKANNRYSRIDIREKNKLQHLCVVNSYSICFQRLGFFRSRGRSQRRRRVDA
jgi:hypothetical protein